MVVVVVASPFWLRFVVGIVEMLVRGREGNAVSSWLNSWLTIIAVDSPRFVSDTIGN